MNQQNLAVGGVHLKLRGDSNYTPGSGARAEAVPRMLMLLAAVGEVGRLARLRGRTQTLSSGGGVVRIWWTCGEGLQPGAGYRVRREGKTSVLSSPITPSPIW